MKLLLTSAGIRNPRIRDALVGLIGKPIAEASALIIPTALYAIPGGAGHAHRLIAGIDECPMAELGWKSLGVLELTALPSVDRSVWLPRLEQTDVLLVGGGDALYLAHWMRQSGLAALLPSLPHLTWVGLSAGSMVMAPAIGAAFIGWQPPDGVDRGLGVVDFAMFPHLDHPALPENTMADAVTWAAGMGMPCYAIDDQTAIQVSGGAIEVISEGQWTQLA